MSTIFHHIQNANDSLKSNRMRTLLTITGVAIGISSIVTILSLAGGAINVITKQVDDVGGNVAIIRPHQAHTTSFADVVNQQAHGATTASTLTDDDVEAIRSIPSSTAVAPVMLSRSTAHGDAAIETALVGTTPDLFATSHINVQSGEFKSGDDSPVALGAQLSVDLFGTEESLGKTLVIKNHSFRVGGILERQQNPMNFNGFDVDTALFMSPTQLSAISPTAQIQQINVQASSVSELDRLVISLNKTLLSQHGNEQDFAVLTGDDIALPMGQMFQIIAGVTIAIAGISLFVGGIGIMNIMLVNVAERTREIGIRKALGASRSDIMWQFLIEAIIMALVGGIVGSILGLTFAFVISLFLTFDPVITWPIIAVAFSIAATVGIVFGLYPALRAAHKNPIEALNLHS